MTRAELTQQYHSYLDSIDETPSNRYSFKYAHYQGILHGLGIALDYDYETVEEDIARAARQEPMTEQIRLAI